MLVSGRVSHSRLDLVCSEKKNWSDNDITRLNHDDKEASAENTWWNKGIKFAKHWNLEAFLKEHLGPGQIYLRNLKNKTSDRTGTISPFLSPKGFGAWHWCDLMTFVQCFFLKKRRHNFQVTWETAMRLPYRVRVLQTKMCFSKTLKNPVVAPYLSFMHQLLNSLNTKPTKERWESVRRRCRYDPWNAWILLYGTGHQGFFSISETHNTTVNSPGGDLGCPKHLTKLLLVMRVHQGCV